MADSVWLDRLHVHREKELERIFGSCPERVFAVGLELGAGDGFQSGLLRKWVRSLVASDVNLIRLSVGKEEGVCRVVCDAGIASRCFRPGIFDLVFCSHLMEHIPDPAQALAGMRALLRPEGVWIGVMPSPFMKLTWMALFYPNRLSAARAALRDPERRKRARSKLRDAGDGDIAWGNNPRGKRYGFLRRQIWPVPHGHYRTNIEEVFKYSSRRWVRLIEDQDFRVVQVLRMPVTTGYSLDWPAFCSTAERLGLASAYAYVAKVAEAGVSLASYWEDRALHGT
jgi:SAM-dependent methyltransferase